MFYNMMLLTNRNVSATKMAQLEINFWLRNIFSALQLLFDIQKYCEFSHFRKYLLSNKI